MKQVKTKLTNGEISRVFDYFTALAGRESFPLKMSVALNLEILKKEVDSIQTSRNHIFRDNILLNESDSFTFKEDYVSEEGSPTHPLSAFVYQTGSSPEILEGDVVKLMNKTRTVKLYKDDKNREVSVNITKGNTKVVTVMDLLSDASNDLTVPDLLFINSYLLQE